MGVVSLETLGLLTGVAFIASFIDAIAGGGGLLTLPALALAGLDPVAALATNKLQSTVGSASATFAFWRAGAIDRRSCGRLMAGAAAGAVMGALLASRLPTRAVSLALPVILALVAAYFAFAPALSKNDRPPRLPLELFSWLVLPTLGFYDGVFGPGTGSFMVLGFVELLGYGALRATAHTKAANFASNIAALLTFVIGGRVAWTVGLAMALGQGVGARLGAHATMRVGSGLVRPMLVLVCLALAARLAFAAR